jgi:type II secretory pathway pseudopilin PulG
VLSRGRRGFSLFEAVAAITIVGLTAVAALEAVGAEVRTAERSRRAIEAAALATERLDAMTLLTDAALVTLPDTVSRGKFDPPLDNYTWETTSTPVNTEQGLYDVRLTVKWSNGSYLLRTYLYRRPLQVTGGRGGRGGRGG